MSFRQMLADAAPNKETALTLGVFDGVHLGHCHLLDRLVRLATPPLIPLVLTFSNHPITVLRPGTTVGHLSTHHQKVELLKAQGVQAVVSLEFTKDLSQISAHDFTSILFDSLGMRGLVVGPDTALGRNREGDLDFLKKCGDEMGFWVEVAEPFVMDGAPVKSRLIRSSISEGDMTASAKMLGRKYSLTGEVIAGDKRGRELGFPTANLKLDESMLMPGDGIYSAWAVVDGVRYPTATSIGIRPTFDLTERLLEVHLIDFNQDIYGKQLCVEFVSKLRDQEKFSGIEELIEKINQDVADARIILEQDRGSQVA
ncbi:MAG: riboflavin biosynthesis protein RibF [SAR202 cluster bacterium Io17-Chloro-G4]|nr:MAG: riboflavin biosynthesis protein RibF [SAR202 cluster bacterium Io17-Chloro-G4]